MTDTGLGLDGDGDVVTRRRFISPDTRPGRSDQPLAD